MLGRFAIRAQKYGSLIAGVFFRRELTQLDAAIKRAKEIYLPLGARWEEQKKTFRFSGGATLKFRPLERDSDAEKYQGHSYTDVFFEELTNYPNDGPYNKLRGTLRSAHGVPVFLCSTGNPGGPGHLWVKERFVDPAPGGWQILQEYIELPGNRKVIAERIYIPSRLRDNQKLVANDPLYEVRLGQTGSAALVRAWLEGDWNIVEGAYFDCWSDAMVLRPFTLPVHWLRFQSFDWGSARPFSAGWWAVASDDHKTLEGRVIPRGAMIRYREWYGKARSNVGLKLPSNVVAQGILSRESEHINYRVADPAVFISDDGPCIGETMQKAGVTFQAADNRRIAGWDQMRKRMIGSEGKPYLYVFSTCADSIRTIPSMQHDDRIPEDLDTDGEDHAADEWRYACMSRPWSAPAPVVVDNNKDQTVGDVVDMTKLRRRRS